MLDLLPAIGRNDELVERASCRQRQQQPMHRRQYQHPGGRQQAAAQQAKLAEEGQRQISASSVLFQKLAYGGEADADQ